MKKIIIAMSVIAIAISSCQKQASILPSANKSSTGELLEAGVTHYYHGKQVSYTGEIASYMSDQSAVVSTDLINNKLEYYYFDNVEEELFFLQQYPALQALYTKVWQAKDMREFAMSSGEMEQYKVTGELSQTYLDYCDKYKTRAWYMLYDGLLGAGANLFIPSARPDLGVYGFNDKAESYSGNFNTGAVFENILYGGLTCAFAFGTPYPVNTPPRNLPGFIRNKVSSAN